VDNITHSLVGVALADLAMGRRATKAQRPLLVGAGIIAANLPDVDLAYSRMTPMPLGYLLHHRGHTHTIAGLVVLALVLVSAYWVFPPLQKMRWSGRIRFVLLIASALASHLGLDALNSYGVHPLYPFDGSWYFGDTLFIFEPFLWLMFGIAVAANARRRTARLAAALPLVALLCTIAWSGIVPLESVGALSVIGGAFGWWAVRVSPRARAATAFALCAVLIAGLAGASRVARGATLEALRPALHGRILDVVLTPNPSSPVCWSVIAIEMRERQNEYVLWRGTLSLAAAWKAPTGCASHRFVGARQAALVGNGRFAVRDEIHQSLPRLRSLAKGDCWVHAWLRFGRAPVIEDGFIFDLRFAERIGQNFSRMRIAPREDCPSNVPGWSMPRGDLLR
jgi:inner membrane protein